jgi:hypothetical protein
MSAATAAMAIGPATNGPVFIVDGPLRGRIEGGAADGGGVEGVGFRWAKGVTNGNDPPPLRQTPPAAQ